MKIYQCSCHIINSSLPVTKLDSVGWIYITCPKVPKVYPDIEKSNFNLQSSLFSYLFAVSRMKKTQGLDVDQTTFTIGSLSTVPAQVIKGLW